CGRVEGEMEDRGHWASKTEFLLAVAGNVVGLGNVWRFPYLCYKNGGGTFLVPYLVFMVTCGVPLFLLETAMGQYTQEGGITCWQRLCPLADGVGYAGQLILIYSCMCYIIVLAWAMLYLVFSFSSQLPWATCDNKLPVQVWMEAGTQVFFSYSVAVGSLTVLGSYNTYKNDCYRDSLWLCVLNSCTSVVAGFAVFSVLGFMAHQQGAAVEDVAESGPGLAFIAYPQAVAMMPLPQLWSVCFFIMIILLGLDTEFVAMEVVITSVTDVFPGVLRRAGRREFFVLFYCLSCFFSQLVMVTQGGMFVFQLFDYYACNGTCILFLAVFESLAVGWIYGAERMSDVIKDMTGWQPNFIFKLCWKYLTPLVSMVSFICSLVEYQPLTFNRWYVYPAWAYGLGWAMALSSIVLVPGRAVILLWAEKGSLKQRWIRLCTPDPDLPQIQRPRPVIHEVTTAAELKELINTTTDQHKLTPVY
uniref:Transporter n=1 Tax=Astyanax mexicanus TaxID=7994 RepID=A0A8B9L1X9_ASTMX